MLIRCRRSARGFHSTPLDQRLWPILVTPDSTTFAVPNYFADSESSGTIRVFVRLATSQEYDQAPDTGRYDYNVHPLSLTAARFTAAGKRAGDRLVLSLAVTRSDTGGPLAAGAIACSAIADARKLVGGSLGFAAGSAPLARCAWKLPRGLAGERVRASITVAFAGRLVTRTAAVTVR